MAAAQIDSSMYDLEICVQSWGRLTFSLQLLTDWLIGASEDESQESFLFYFSREFDLMGKKLQN